MEGVKIPGRCLYEEQTGAGGGRGGGCAGVGGAGASVGIQTNPLLTESLYATELHKQRGGAGGSGGWGRRGGVRIHQSSHVGRTLSFLAHSNSERPQDEKQKDAPGGKTLCFESTGLIQFHNLLLQREA